MIREREAASLPGLPVLIVLLLALGLTIYALATETFGSGPATVIMWVVLIVIEAFLLMGIFVVNPNEGRVMQFFGDYVGTAKNAGLRWANPFYTKKRISLRIR